MPQLDIISFPSQIIWLSSVFVIGVYFSLKYILPSSLSILHVRKFLTDAHFQSKLDLETSIAINFIRNFNSSLNDLLVSQDNEFFDVKLFSVIKEKQKITEKFFLSPFFFFFVNDVFILMIAFFVSFSGIFFYLYSHYSDIFDNKNVTFLKKAKKRVLPPATLTSILKKD